MVQDRKQPDAYAVIKGDEKHPELYGEIYFYGVYKGTLIMAEVKGLPVSEAGENGGFYGFHIHEGGSCTGDKEEPFKDVKMHYNPNKLRHPWHSGDLPPLLGVTGTAWLGVYTDRFYPEEVIGRTAVVHDRSDDFHTQPSGGSGNKIGCGVIMLYDEQF